MEDADPREDEMASISAIYPELVVSESDPYTFSLLVSVNPVNPVRVTFPAANTAAPAPPAAPANLETESHELSFLPSLLLTLTLPPGYPEAAAPSVSITTTPSWLPQDTRQRLQGQVVSMWDEMGRDLVVFSYIDHVQSEAENVFGITDKAGALELDSRHKIAVLDYDIKAKRADFEKQTYECGICLDPKKGASCHEMMDCGHVFCVACLQDFYSNAITEGDLSSVRCLAPGCAKEREKKFLAEKKAAAKAENPHQPPRRRKPKIFISPAELLQIPVESELVKRYVKLKYKNQLESDKTTVYCPRKWCQGAARSKNRKKPEDFELGAESDSDGGADVPGDDAEAEAGGSRNDESLLAICEDCGFAFCRRCTLSWHGEFVRCRDPQTNHRVTEEEKMSLEYLKYYTTPCPTCDAPAQKTQGCNHMRCFRCGTHFCYLCSSWLDPSNPYQHFNSLPDGRKTACYNRLWELEQGDGDDVGIGFFGGAGQGQRRARQLVHNPGPPQPQQAPGQQRRVPEPEIEEPESEDDGEAAGRNENVVEVEREGPLVLRIHGGAVRVPPPAPIPPPAPAPRRGRGAGGARGAGAAAARPAQRDGGGRGGRGGRGRGRAGAMRDPRNRLAPGGGGAPRVGPQPVGEEGERPARAEQQRQQPQHNRQHNMAQRAEGVGRRPIAPPEIDENDDDDDDGDEHEHDVANERDAVGENVVHNDLNPEQVAWIQNFVQLALVDEEDDMEDDNVGQQQQQQQQQAPQPR